MEQISGGIDNVVQEVCNCCKDCIYATESTEKGNAFYVFLFIIFAACVGLFVAGIIGILEDK